MTQVFSQFTLRRLFDTTCRKGIYHILFTQAVIFLLFWLGSFFAPSQHKFFYLDYLYLPFLFRIHWLLGTVATVPMVLFDFYFSIDSANGLSFTALLGLIREIPHAGAWGYQLGAIALVLFALVSIFVARQYRKVGLKAATIVFVVMAVIYYPAKKMTTWPILSVGLTGPIFYALILQDTFFFERLNPGNMHFTPLAQPSWLTKAIKGEPKILSIVFESYGIDKSKPQINQYFEKEIRKALPKREVYSGVIPYSGSTVNGELRELCSVRTDGVMLDSVPKEHVCLPQKLARQGYTTVAFHNNKGGFYDRLRWYPSIGFATFIDRNIMLEKGYAPSQYAFGGIADKEMAEEISRWLANHKKIFAHWITLDSHGPYSKALAPAVTDCKKLAITEAAQCNYVNTLQNTFAAIIFIAKQHPDVKIVVSGDHAPHFESVSQPLIGKRLNALFDHQNVPALVIEPIKTRMRQLTRKSI
jgi:hypothetical protein